MRFKYCMVGLVDNAGALSLDKSVCASVRLVTASLRVLNSPTCAHLKPFSVPDMSLKPSSRPSLPQFELIKQKPELASMPAAFISANYLGFARDHLIESLYPYSCRNSVIVVGHGAPSLMAGQQLVLQLGRQFRLEYFCEVLQLKGTCRYELMNVDKLWHCLLLRFHLVGVVPGSAHLASFVRFLFLHLFIIQ